MNQQLGLGKRSGKIKTGAGERFVVNVGDNWNCPDQRPILREENKGGVEKRETGYNDEFDGGECS
jgi:hypothetical protein